MTKKFDFDKKMNESVDIGLNQASKEDVLQKADLFYDPTEIIKSFAKMEDAPLSRNGRYAEFALNDTPEECKNCHNPQSFRYNHIKYSKFTYQTGKTYICKATRLRFFFSSKNELKDIQIEITKYKVNQRTPSYSFLSSTNQNLEKLPKEILSNIAKFLMESFPSLLTESVDTNINSVDTKDVLQKADESISIKQKLSRLIKTYGKDFAHLYPDLKEKYTLTLGIFRYKYESLLNWKIPEIKSEDEKRLQIGEISVIKPKKGKEYISYNAVIVGIGRRFGLLFDELDIESQSIILENIESMLNLISNSAEISESVSSGILNTSTEDLTNNADKALSLFEQMCELCKKYGRYSENRNVSYKVTSFNYMLSFLRLRDLFTDSIPILNILDGFDIEIHTISYWESIENSDTKLNITWSIINNQGKSTYPNKDLYHKYNTFDKLPTDAQINLIKLTEKLFSSLDESMTGLDSIGTEDLTKKADKAFNCIEYTTAKRVNFNVSPSQYKNKENQDWWDNCVEDEFISNGKGKIFLKNGCDYIGKYAFSHCTWITSITIPDSITSIKEGAFNGCSELDSLTIPDSVINIEDYAFYMCGMKTISIGNSVQKIGEKAFGACENLRNLTLPNSVQSIGKYAFFCRTGYGINTIIIPNSVKNIANFIVNTSNCKIIRKDVNESVDININNSSTETLLDNSENYIISKQIKEYVKKYGDYYGESSRNDIETPVYILNYDRAIYDKFWTSKGAAYCNQLETLEYNGEEILLHTIKYFPNDDKLRSVFNYPWDKRVKEMENGSNFELRRKLKDFSKNPFEIQERVLEITKIIFGGLNESVSTIDNTSDKDLTREADTPMLVFENLKNLILEYGWESDDNLYFLNLPSWGRRRLLFDYKNENFLRKICYDQKDNLISFEFYKNHNSDRIYSWKPFKELNIDYLIDVVKNIKSIKSDYIKESITQNIDNASSSDLEKESDEKITIIDQKTIMDAIAGLSGYSEDLLYNDDIYGFQNELGDDFIELVLPLDDNESDCKSYISFNADGDDENGWRCYQLNLTLWRDEQDGGDYKRTFILIQNKLITVNVFETIKEIFGKIIDANYDRCFPGDSISKQITEMEIYDYLNEKDKLIYEELLKEETEFAEEYEGLEYDDETGEWYNPDEDE